MADAVRLSAADVVHLNPIYHYRWEEAQQAHILLYPEGLVRLNDTAAAVLGQCRTHRPVSAVIDSLAATYGDTAIEAEILEFLQICLDKGWICVCP